MTNPTNLTEDHIKEKLTELVKLRAKMVTDFEAIKRQYEIERTALEAVITTLEGLINPS